MRTYSAIYRNAEMFRQFLDKHGIVDSPALLVQIFTSLRRENDIAALREAIVRILPSARIIGATTDGSIIKGKVTDATHVVAVTRFEHIRVRTAFVPQEEESFIMGRSLAAKLWSDKAKLLLTFTDGLHTDGEAFLQGIRAYADDVVVAGGMAGDGGLFHKTFVFDEHHISDKGAVAAVLEGERLFVSADYSFDWLPIGQPMRVTRAERNRVYRINRRSAAETYRHYLGDEVYRHLPSTGIDFPLIIHRNGAMIARAVTACHEDGSLSFAGTLHPGDTVTFGYGNPELILAHAPALHRRIAARPVETVFVYSCTARKRLMPLLIKHETEPLQYLAETVGFFTYGEFVTASSPQLFNQTMAVVALSESPAIRQIVPPEYPLPESATKLSINALSHLLQTTTNELQRYNDLLRKRTEEIRAKKASLQLAQEVGRFGSWEIDLRTQKASWSKELYRIYGYPESFVPDSQTFLSMVVPEQRRQVYDAVLKAYEGALADFQTVVRRPDGKEIHVWVNGKVVFDAHNEPLKLIGTTLDITELVKLREQNRELAAIIEEMNQEIYIVDAETRTLLYANRIATEKLGYTYDELLSLSLSDIATSLSVERCETIIESLRHQKSLLSREIHTKKNGETYPVQAYIQRGIYNRREVYIFFSIDITELVEAETRYRHQAQILEQISDGVVSFDLDGHITLWNHGATLLYGYDAQTMLDREITDIYPETEHKEFALLMQRALKEGAATGELLARKKNGEHFYTLLSLSVLKDDRQQTIGLTAYMHDITDKKRIENTLRRQTEMLDFQAHHDTLTLLPNRIYFEKYLTQAIRDASKNDERFAVLFIDLDNFKHINDSLGHHYGDELLKIVAKRLHHEIRRSDFLARLGGDEFTIVLRHIDNNSVPARISEKIIASLTEAFVIEAHRLHISGSIGISLYPDDAVTYQDLLKFADTAMYEAKENGKNAYMFYNPKMTFLAYQKVTSELSLRQAFDHKELRVHYQPFFDIRSQKPIGIEALIRWKHPQKGLLLPQNILPLAQEHNCMIELNRFVFKRAIEEYRQLNEEGIDPRCLALNISAKELTDSKFLPQFTRILDHTGFDPKHLEFEISENELSAHFHLLKDLLAELHQLGVRISVDDFGTGELSLHQMQQLPLHAIKVDISLVETLPANDENRRFVTSLLAVSDTLDIRIIAEGVENEEQLDFLKTIGCHTVQGYYYTKAMPLHDLKRYWRTHMKE